MSAQDNSAQQQAPDSALSRRQLEEIVRELEAAVEETRQWLALFHRALVCRLRPDPEVVTEDAHRMSRFGRWYSTNRDDDIFSQPAFAMLVDMHQGLYAHAAILAVRGWKEDKIPAEEYDALLHKIDSFNEQAGRMARAFRAALSDLDPLTGTNTRSTMERELMREQQRMRRSGRPCSIAIADIDKFKSVNDTYGHQAGDRVLARVTRIIEDTLRPYDSIYRFGGEEFLICLPDSGPEDARRVLDRVRNTISETPISIDTGDPLSITVSFGVAQLVPRRSLKDIMERADRALYEAKNGGRNQVVVWTAELV
ncbi:diguanylate cyclase [Nisaea nitritireducens]|uniref:diguanylate cyclase n=1 Tax=Nisaea nitritireducens TaxID=568392 RepID=UPI0029C0F752|nr:diguanylate cyclase [Nisaea nitritireducens]